MNSLLLKLLVFLGLVFGAAGLERFGAEPVEDSGPPMIEPHCGGCPPPTCIPECPEGGG